MTLTFEWDARKAAANVTKHGISFAEALTVFADPLGRVEDDDRHSVSEPRFVLLERSSADRLLAVMFIERGPERIRLLSVRQATPRAPNAVLMTSRNQFGYSLSRERKSVQAKASSPGRRSNQYRGRASRFT